MSANPPTILILGAAYSGIAATHRLLRSLPAEYKVILVNPSTQFYWNIAAPRAIAKNNSFGADNADLFAPITPGFAAHPATRFEFVQGLATGADPKSSTVTVQTSDDDGVPGAERTIPYTQLIITTGAAAIDNWPLKSSKSHKLTLQALKDAQVKIEAAKTIVLSGAGPTGVETAGEIGTLFRGSGKTIILISADDRVLPQVREDVGKSAQTQLKSLGVVVKLGTRVTEETQRDGSLHMVLSNGETIAADLHMPTYGLVPNTQFLPAELVDGGRGVKVAMTMQNPQYDNIWAAGDAAAVNFKGAVVAGAMMSIMVNNVIAAVAGKGKETFKKHKDEAGPMIVPIGGDFAMGTGYIGGFKVWGFLVWLLKGRKYFSGNVKSVALGKTLTTGEKV